MKRKWWVTHDGPTRKAHLMTPDEKGANWVWRMCGGGEWSDRLCFDNTRPRCKHCLAAEHLAREGGAK
jgi:hypothetical protein